MLRPTPSPTGRKNVPASETIRAVASVNRANGTTGAAAANMRGLRGRASSNAVRGLEEDLLERAGQVTAPHQGRRRGQRMIFNTDPDHVVQARRPGQPDQPGPDPGDETGACQYRGRPVPGRGEDERHGQRMLERRIGELEAPIGGPQNRPPALVSRPPGPPRPVYPPLA